jgi:RHS repeat-associated protein
VFGPASFAAADIPADIDLGIDPSSPPAAGEVIAGGLNLLNGNLVEVRNDLVFPSPNRLGLAFQSFYNSRSSTLGDLGYGWSHSFAAGLTLSNGSTGFPYHKISDATGRGVYFSCNTTGTFPGAFQERSQLRLEGTQYVWYRLDGSKLGFNNAGRLRWMEDPVGNRLSLDYATVANAQRLKTITDSATGRVLTFNYRTDGLLLSIQGPVSSAVPNGLWVNFGYDTAKNLTTVTYADGSGFKYEYDSPASHNLTRKRDMADHILAEWRYDTSDRCILYFRPDGKGVKTVAYVSETTRDVTDAYNVTRSYTIGSAGGRKRVVSMTGTTNPPYSAPNGVSWAYDTSMRLTQVRYAGGTFYTFANYDSRANPGTVTLAAGTSDARVIQYTYHPEMNIPLSRSEQGVLGSGNKVTIWDYDNPGTPGNTETPNENPTRLLYRIIESGSTKNSSAAIVSYRYVTTVTYNGKGQVLSVDGPLAGSNDKINYGYSTGTFNLLSITLPLIGATALSQYDAAGLPGQLTDVNGQIQTFTYDGRMRLREIAYQADGSRRIIDYNTAGLLESTVDNDDVSLTYAYEPTYGRLDRTTETEGDYIDNGYDDAQGNLTSMSYRDQSGMETRLKRWSYQHPVYAGLLWKKILADGTFTEYDYDDAGNIKEITDPNGHTTLYSYDPLNRLSTVIQPGNVTTSYDYDRHGNLNSVTDAEAHKTTYTYDDMGRIVSSASPDTGTTTYVYDAAGNLLSKTDARGITVQYTWDLLNRIKSVASLTAYTVSYTYDEGDYAKGHLTKISDPSGTTVLNYNARGRFREKVVTIGSSSFTLSRDLTPGGRVSKMTYPGDNPRTLDFTRSGCACRVTGISTSYGGTTNVLADQLAYRPFGESTGMNVGNGGRVNNIFDLDGRMTTANPGAVMQTNFTYDGIGRLETISVGAGLHPYLQALYNRSFTYDELDRLQDAEGPFGTDLTHATINFSYDDAGNRLTKTGGIQTESYDYVSGSNRLSKITAGATTTSFVHDANGNIVTKGARQFVYNQDNRLVQVKSGASELGRYTYNGLGQRTTKTAASTVTYYLYDFDGNLIAETDGSGAIRSEYLYRGRVRLARADRAPSALYFYHNDQLGTPQFLTDTSNTVVWEGIYDPFGFANVNPNSTITNNFRFQGQYFDSETEYHYNHHRYYDPKTGRYLTPDPIGLAGGINPYLYVAGSDPINAVDPDGLDAIYVHYDYYPVNTGYGFHLPLGHAGVVAVDPTTGKTRYFEFGRYDNQQCGKVRSQGIPNVKIGKDGLPTQDSLKCLYDYLSKNIGHGSNISATYYPDSDYRGTINFAEKFIKSHPCYNLLDNNCKTFAQSAATACKEGQTCE